MLPLRFFALPPKIGIAAAISFATLVLVSFFLYQLYARPLEAFNINNAVSEFSSTADISARGGAAASMAYAATVAPLPEIHIANNGLVLLRGAQVISVSGDTIKIQMTWNSVYFSWVVQTSTNTQFFGSTGERVTSPTIHPGDVVTATGMLVQNGSQPTISAQYIDLE